MEPIVQAVLFDLDGVLVNSIPAHGRAWTWIMKEEFGIDVDPFIAPLTEGMRSRRIARLIFEAAGYDDGLNLPEEELDRIIERKRAYYRKIVGDIRISEEIYRAVLIIRSRVQGIAVVTSSAKSNLDKMIPRDKQAVFNVALWADSVRKVKPDPEPYFKAAERVGISPEHTLVIENAPLGIRSARAAGMWCVAITSTMPRDKLTEAHLVLESVTELASEEKWEWMESVFNRIGRPGKLPPEDVLVAPIPVHRTEAGGGR